MTAPSYTHDLTDVDLAEATTNWAESSDSNWDDGGGATADSDYPFIQGTVAITQQATKATIASLLVDNGSGITLPTDGAYFIWQVFSSSTGLDTYVNGGMTALVGSSLADFYAWDIGGSDFGRNPYGGWMNHALNTTVSSDDTIGTPTGTEQYIGAAVRPLVAIGKGNPHGVDAIRYGRGSSIFEYGDISNGYCIFSGFATKNDYNDVTNGYNRWGLIQGIPGGFLFKGKMTLGTASNAVDFRDSNVSILIDNTPKVTSGFNRIEVNNASSRVDWTNVNITALGTISRGNFEAVDNADINKDYCTFTDMGTFTYQSNSSIDVLTYRRCNLITTGGAAFAGCTFDNTNDSVKAVTVSSPANAALITGSTFISSGTKHGLEITGTAGNITLTNDTWTGYAATDGSTGNEAIYVNIASGSMEITISGGTTPSIRTAGCSVTVNSDTTVTFTGMKDNSEVRVYKTSDDSVVAGIEDATAGSPDDRSFSWAAPASTNVYYVIHNWENGVPVYETIRVNGYIVPASDASIGIQQRIDRNAE